jgi:hypothetical protein
MFESIAWIVVVNLVLYFKTLRYKFVSDDLAVFMNPPTVKNWWHKQWMRFTGQIKLKNKSFSLRKIQGKLKCVIAETEEMEHLIALLLHISICVMIYLAFNSWLAALLYSVNPVNNQGTIWPGGRGYAIPILCIILAFTWDWAAIPAILFCQSFTIGFLAPLVALGASKWWLVWVGVLGWIIHARKFVKAVKSKSVAESFTEDRLSFHPKKFVLAIKTFGFYTLLCLIPSRITFYHNFLQSAAGSGKDKAYSLCKYFWAGLTILTMMIWFWTSHPWTILSWALLAWCISVAPFCNFVRANQEIAERFVALPNVFLTLALALLIAPYPILITAFLVFYATRTYYTLPMYKDEYFITEVAVIEDPHAWWAWHCRAMKRWDTQSYKEALILWVMARLISPREFKILMNIATCLRLLKNNQEADQFLKMAEENIVPGQEKEAREFIKQHKAGKLPILL